MEKTPSQSHCTMTELILPSHANAMGNVFGGQVMSWIDICAAIAASRHTEGTAVTASVDDLHFLVPMTVGDLCVLEGEVVYAGRTSVDIVVNVWREDVKTHSRKLTTTAWLTFVALDSKGKARKVPKIRPETEKEKELNKQALKKRQERLKRR